ncbi:hypothetical protein L218DRAFT_918805 [Marasmius fiardii PR-910]|nr:hypothetical protein L218DRAFT_918805 [Marasmius fiardii PR-910]
MPRENRKRGKRVKKQTAETTHEEPELEPSTEPGPSWIVPNEEESNPEAPFGYVDADIKAYFRTVDTQIQNWQDEDDSMVEGEEDQRDPNSEKRIFFNAALTEMTGKEKQLATDPDCSIVLERMAHSMDDFLKRVFLDSLSGSYEKLVRHRFASHVCQTLIYVSFDTISRELNGILPPLPDSPSPENGELRTMAQLILDICEELLPSLNSLVMDPFASHVIRVLLSLLSGSQPSSNLRSKKSSAWKSKQGNLKSLFSDRADRDSKGKSTAPDHQRRLSKLPAEFGGMSRRFVMKIRQELGGNEVRALAASDVASPCLTMLLHIESDNRMADEEDSLMDRMTVGVISASLKLDTEDIQPSDYLGTLFRDPTSSHVLETIMTRVSERPFALLWTAYLKGKLPRLSVHPVANYVVGKSMGRCIAGQLREAYEELEGSWEKFIITGRTSVLRAIIQRSASLRVLEEEAVHALSKALGLSTPEEMKLLVPSALRLKTIQEYESSKNDTEKSESKTKEASSPTVQGSLLLQTVLTLSEPYNERVIQSFTSLDTPQRLKIAQDPTGSRILDAILDSPTVSQKSKRGLVMSFMGVFHELVDDRVGSRVGDRLFGFADTYLKEKIARSVIPHEQSLIASFYGKFFSRNLNLYLLRRRPDEWRSLQSQTKAQITATQAAEKGTLSPHVGSKAAADSKEETASEPQPERKKEKKRKRKTEMEGGDEIDQVFARAPLKKFKGSVPAAVTTTATTTSNKHDDDDEDEKSSKSKSKSKNRDAEAVVHDDVEGDPSLKDVFDAIKSAPKSESRGKGKFKKRKK